MSRATLHMARPGCVSPELGVPRLVENRSYPLAAQEGAGAVPGNRAHPEGGKSKM